MSNPTSNFNWQMPTATDLVTDLPADFEVFGQAVDTSLADLKGGTTGQVLSKTSGTDMDFTWVAQDDSNAIQNAIVDAKGDLIAASAADTPARLAVGATVKLL
jgi:NifU-like protein involved in Fe-S cluster formation